MPKSQHRTGRGERVVTALIWFFTVFFVGLAVAVFFDSWVLLGLGVLVAALVTWGFDREIVRRRQELEEV